MNTEYCGPDFRGDQFNIYREFESFFFCIIYDYSLAMGIIDWSLHSAGAFG